jgi:hypothetical protein
LLASLFLFVGAGVLSAQPQTTKTDKITTEQTTEKKTVKNHKGKHAKHINKAEKTSSEVK